MNGEVLEVLEEIKEQGQILLQMCRDESMTMEILASRAANTATVIDAIESIIPVPLYRQYKEFFSAFSVFCRRSDDPDFLMVNKGEMISSLELFEECLDDLKNRMQQTKKCPC